MLDSLSGSDPAVSGAPRPRADAELLQEHNGLLALASAVATAASSTRSVAGEFPWPYYFIGTRDCFTYHLVAKTEVSPPAYSLHIATWRHHCLVAPMLTYLLAEQVVKAAGRKYKRTEYFFPANQLPENYHSVRVHFKSGVQPLPRSAKLLHCQCHHRVVQGRPNTRLSTFAGVGGCIKGKRPRHPASDR